MWTERMVDSTGTCRVNARRMKDRAGTLAAASLALAVLGQYDASSKGHPAHEISSNTVETC